MKTTSQPASLSNLRLAARAGLLLNGLASLLPASMRNAASVAGAVKAVAQITAITDIQAATDAGCALPVFTCSGEHGYQDYGYYWTRMIDIRGGNP
ncbi:hypothetical protein H8L32_07090 [Undibacterium sp. CY18W]|uniref:Uncharacterized protein n=1 Tax=Undibacterium hunanense TaxID=2762292 RepID=A0ABR6ZMZ1_9BURK|nr:hypothetical protein [Undibacterium hunanense]MBC3917233.1 hypothetical protein [Undibacterium hunanense]